MMVRTDDCLKSMCGAFSYIENMAYLVFMITALVLLL
jgi:hypothetical protein